MTKNSSKTQLNELLKKIENYKHGSGLSPSGRLNKYKKQYVTGKKKIKGQWVLWDEKLDKPFNKKEVEKNLYHVAIGTTTPDQDLEYWNAKVKFEDKVNLGSNPLRRALSHKVSGSDETVYDKEWQLQLEQEKDKLNALGNKSSAGIKDILLEAPTSGSAAEVKTKVLEEKGGKPLTPADQIKIASEEAKKGGVSNATPEMKAFSMDRLRINPGDKLKFVSGKTYLGDTAVGNNQESLTIPKKEEKKEKPKPFLRSDVFTLDKDGNRLGVLTNRQRLAWDKENQGVMTANQLKINNRTYSSGFVGAG